MTHKNTLGGDLSIQHFLANCNVYQPYFVPVNRGITVQSLLRSFPLHLTLRVVATTRFSKTSRKRKKAFFGEFFLSLRCLLYAQGN